MTEPEDVIDFVEQFLATHPGSGFEEVLAAANAAGFELRPTQYLQAQALAELASDGPDHGPERWGLEFGYQWMFGDRPRTEAEVRAELEDSARWIRENSGEDVAAELPPLDEVVVPFPRLILTYRGVPDPEGEYEECQIELEGDRDTGFTVVGLITKVHHATFDHMQPADHRYPEGFDQVGTDPDSGLPVIQMHCGS